MGREVSFDGASNDVRELRFRQGSLDPDSSKSGINLLDATNMIFDHVSVEFAQWNNIDFAVSATRTCGAEQTSIDADLVNRSPHAEDDFTWYRNVFANAHNRNPLAKADTQYINNVVYDFQAGYTAGNTSGHFAHDLVNNYFVSGPATASASDAIYPGQHPADRLHGQSCRQQQGWDAQRQPDGSARRHHGLDGPLVANHHHHPDDDRDRRLCQRGGRRGRVLHRDQVDSLVIADVTSLGKGACGRTRRPPACRTAGTALLNGGTPATDGDDDGMPDTWEEGTASTRTTPPTPTAASTTPATRTSRSTSTASSTAATLRRPRSVYSSGMDRRYSRRRRCGGRWDSSSPMRRHFCLGLLEAPLSTDTLATMKARSGGVGAMGEAGVPFPRELQRERRIGFAELVQPHHQRGLADQRRDISRRQGNGVGPAVGVASGRSEIVASLGVVEGAGLSEPSEDTVVRSLVPPTPRGPPRDQRRSRGAHAHDHQRDDTRSGHHHPLATVTRAVTG